MVFLLVLIWLLGLSSAFKVLICLSLLIIVMEGVFIFFFFFTNWLPLLFFVMMSEILKTS